VGGKNVILQKLEAVVLELQSHRWWWLTADALFIMTDMSSPFYLEIF
jgi:hypothetical protein